MAYSSYRTTLKILLYSVSFMTVMIPALGRAGTLPNGFVCLRKLDPSIQQDIRYATSHNFIGSPIHGYQAGECILTRQAAQTLVKVQQELLLSGLGLKVYDCYRPQAAVDEFIAWAAQPKNQKMKQEFYPHVNKADFFKLGYVAAKSGHSRGSTVDLTIIPLPPTTHLKNYNPKAVLISCTAAYTQRFHDGGIDMGTGFDCMDPLSHNDNQGVNTVAWYHRLILKTLMEKHGFSPLREEWWHFTLKQEPFPDTYFNFPVFNCSNR